MYYILQDFGEGLQIIHSFENEDEGPYLKSEYSIAHNSPTIIVNELELKEMKKDLQYKIDLLTDD